MIAQSIAMYLGFCGLLAINENVLPGCIILREKACEKNLRKKDLNPRQLSISCPTLALF